MSFTVRRLQHDRTGNILYASARYVWLLRPLLHLRVILSAWREQRKEWKRRERLLRGGVILLVVMLCAGILFLAIEQTLHILQPLSISQILSAGSAALPTDAYGHTNILLLGQGDELHDGKDLIDSILVASINPESSSIVLLSLPRDLYFLHTEEMGTGRLNSLYRDQKYALRRKGIAEKEASLRAMRSLGDEVGRSLNLAIHHMIKVDFTGFTDLIDAIGGVTVDIKRDLEDPEFPGPNSTFEPFNLPAGRQSLNGETALKYVRSRASTSDFDRSRRQQELLSALGEKVRAEGFLRKPGKLLALFKVLHAHVETTMTTRELLHLANLGKHLREPRLLSFQLHDRNGLYEEPLQPGGFLYTPPRNQFDGAAVLLPISIPEFPVTWKQVQTFTHLLFHTRTLHRNSPRIAILNAGAPVGTARRLAEEFIRYGLPPVIVKNASTPKSEHSLILPTTATESSTILTALLGFPEVHPPVVPPPEEQGDVTILLGKDYRFTRFQDLLRPPPTP